ncbi:MULTISPECIES: TadE/TadG family type IV pilus assembly protein [unclassified Solwaraspora]|uniref:TadE/TadG family type IV pilus assembly protein n=1 Tax=unclassified Solwaraspora TaxID=2627926 RepID=UPI00259BE823|nr:TadE/TadG family type IV pilus assembly protein [Solwaraspora sp. WMMA2056]WJK43846.1 TadE/TadG family type IV pilus assembly protein [Solwaraspora sp. WMMA2056]
MRRQAARRGTDAAGAAQRGSISVEVAILTPVFLLLIVVAWVSGRTVVARNALDAAAHDAARAASISRTKAEAQTHAAHAVQQRLDWAGIACADEPVPNFQHDGVDTLTAAFDSPPGAATALIHVRITCAVRFDDLGLPWVPDDRLLSAEFRSPLDRFRGRQ